MSLFRNFLYAKKSCAQIFRFPKISLLTSFELSVRDAFNVIDVVEEIIEKTEFSGEWRE